MKRGIRLALGSFALAFVGLFASVGSEGCRTPTQITVELRTLGGLPCSSLKGVAIVVARTSQDAEDKMQQGLLSAEVPRGVCERFGVAGHELRPARPGADPAPGPLLDREDLVTQLVAELQQRGEVLDRGRSHTDAGPGHSSSEGVVR